MELPPKRLQQIEFITRPRMEERLMIVLEESTHGENLSQPLQNNNEQFKIPVNFLMGSNGIYTFTKQKISFISQHQSAMIISIQVVFHQELVSPSLDVKK